MTRPPRPDTLSLVYSKTMETFVAVCQQRSFTKAAEVLQLSQSAVSQNILRLEEMLGVTLFVRGVRPIGLTPEAVLLKDQLDRHASEMADSILHIREENALRPVIRAAVVESLSPNIAPALVQALAAQSKSVSMLTGTSDIIINELLHQQVDVIVASEPFHAIDGLSRYFLFEEPHVLIVPPDMAAQRGAWRWEDLQYCGRPVVRYAGQSSSGKTIEALFQRLRLSLPLRFEADTSRVLFSLVAAGVGWGVTTPLCLLQCVDLLPGMRVLPAPPPTLARELYVITRKGESERLARLVLEICAARLRETISGELVIIAPWIEPSLKIHAPAEGS